MTAKTVFRLLAPVARAAGVLPPLLLASMFSRAFADPLAGNLSALLPAAAGRSETAPPATGLDALIHKNSNPGPTAGLPASQDEFLKADEAFRLDARMDHPDSVQLSWVIAEGYYLYKQRISIKSDTPNVQLGAVRLPRGIPKHDEFLGDMEVYHEVLEGTVPVAGRAGTSGRLQLRVTYQGCAEAGLCYPPITKTVSLQIPTIATGVRRAAPRGPS